MLKNMDQDKTYIQENYMLVKGRLDCLLWLSQLKALLPNNTSLSSTTKFYNLKAD